MLEALTPVCTTGDGNCLWNAISICLCGRDTYTANCHWVNKIQGEDDCTATGAKS